MSHVSEVESSLPQGTGKSHKLLYTVLAFAAIVLLVIGLFSYSQNRKDAEALSKAQQLSTLFEASGLRTPEDLTVFSSVFGTDGGAMCEDPNSALNKALFDVAFANGAAGVGIRPIVADARVVKGELLALQVYCPDKVAGFQQYVKDQKFDDVINE
ncbi:MAG: hypothetical protein QM648_08290 [Solirubrobacterales bacterium]